MYFSATNVSEIDAAFAETVKRQIGTLYVVPDAYFITRAGRLAELSNRYAVPTSAEMPEFPHLGGLTSYGMDLRDINRLAGIYVAGF